MKRTIIVGVACALLGSSLSSLSLDWGDDSAASYFRADRGQTAPGSPVARGNPSRAGSLARERAADLVAVAVRQYAGDAWVAEGLKIAKVESGYRCDAVGPSTRHGKAVGIGQLIYSSAEALEPGSGKRRSDCLTGARLLALHMAKCIAFGATTDAMMNRCYVGGWGSLSTRLNRRAEQYVVKYQHMVSAAEPRTFTGGWLGKGTVSIF